MRLWDFHTKQMAASRAPLPPVAAGAPAQPPAVQSQAKVSQDMAPLSPPPSSKSSLDLEEHVALDGVMQSFLQDGELSQKEMELYQQVRDLFTSSPTAAPPQPPVAAPVDTAPVEPAPQPEPAPVQEAPAPAPARMPAPGPAPLPAPAPARDAAPAPRPAPAPAPVVQPAPRGDGRRVELSESFDGPNGVFVSSKDFWANSDIGRSKNADWFSESGQLDRRDGQGVSSSSAWNFRMWTRRNDLAFSRVEMDVRFDGWHGGDQGWHGINLWMNRTLTTPFPSGRKLDDGALNGGYALDFMNRNGQVTILKKTPGDTRAQYRGGMSYVEGGTYYQMAATNWKPEPGRTYRFAGEVVDNENGTATLRISVDGKVILEALDDGKRLGPVLRGGRVGLRSDYARYAVDNLTISK